MSLWDRIRAALLPSAAGKLVPRGGEPAPRGGEPAPRGGEPSLEEMRTLLRAGMTRDEFFDVLEELTITRGLRMSMPTNDDRLIGLPVAEGGQLLCFLPEGVLNYVEYKGGIFLEKEG